MKTRVMAALLAAAAMIPGMAIAQDAPQRGERRAQAERNDGQQAQRPQSTDEQRARQAERRAGRQQQGGDDRQQMQRRDRNGDGTPDVRRDRDGNGNGGAIVRRDRDNTPDVRGGRGGDPRFDDRENRGQYGRDDRNDGWRQGGYASQQRYGYGNSQRWSNSWRQDGRYDWNRYRSYNRSAFRLPRYYAPSGWNYGYRRFSAGIRISSALFGQNYWISDPWDYRLPPAYGPYRWVRYYNDAILVDVRSGYVVDVINGIFW